jgi:hypothetical protein
VPLSTETESSARARGHIPNGRFFLPPPTVLARADKMIE